MRFQQIAGALIVSAIFLLPSLAVAQAGPVPPSLISVTKDRIILQESILPVGQRVYFRNESGLQSDLTVLYNLKSVFIAMGAERKEYGYTLRETGVYDVIVNFPSINKQILAKISSVSKQDYDQARSVSITLNVKATDRGKSGNVPVAVPGIAQFIVTLKNEKTAAPTANITSFTVRREGRSSDNDMQVAALYEGAQAKYFPFKDKKAVINLGRPISIGQGQTRTVVINAKFDRKAQGGAYQLSLEAIGAKDPIRFMGTPLPVFTATHFFVSGPSIEDLSRAGVWSASSTPEIADKKIPYNLNSTVYKKLKMQTGNDIDFEWFFPGASVCSARTFGINDDQTPNYKKEVFESQWSGKTVFPNRGWMTLKPNESRFYTIRCNFVISEKFLPDYRGVMVLVGEKIKPTLSVKKENTKEPISIKAGSANQRIGLLAVRLEKSDYDVGYDWIEVKISSKSTGVSKGKYEPYLENFVLKLGNTILPDVESESNSDGSVTISASLSVTSGKQKPIGIYADVASNAPDKVKAALILDYVSVSGAGDITGGKNLTLQEYEIAKPEPYILSFTANGQENSFSAPKQKLVKLNWKLKEKSPAECVLYAARARDGGGWSYATMIWKDKIEEETTGPFAYIVENTSKTQYSLNCKTVGGAEEKKDVIVDAVSPAATSVIDDYLSSADKLPLISAFTADGSSRVINMNKQKEITLKWNTAETNIRNCSLASIDLSEKGELDFTAIHANIFSKDAPKGEQAHKTNLNETARRYGIDCLRLSAGGGGKLDSHVKYIVVNAVDKTKK